MHVRHGWLAGSDSSQTARYPGGARCFLGSRPMCCRWPGVSATRAAYDANHPWLRRVNREVASALLVRAENAARVSAGLPEIGARWVSELQALHFVRASLPQFEVVHQGRPSWLERQSFDIYIPEIGVAIEYQGVQHDGPVDYFGGQAAFEATRERDARKRRLCLENGVRLVEIREGYDADRLLNELNDAVASRQSTNS